MNTRVIIKSIFACMCLLFTLVAFGAEQDMATAKNIILIGPPASGKGTQAKAISDKYKIPAISTGDLLRAEVKTESPRAQRLKETMASGALVDDATVLELMKERLAQEDTKPGFLLDGFPRTIEQAKGLESMGVSINYIVVLDVPDEEIIRRISGRRIHPGSGRTYHEEFNPPKVPGLDDETGEPLIQREDDTETAVKNRLEIYHQQTAPVIDWYKEKAQQAGSEMHYIVVDGTQPIETIKDTVLDLLKH